MKVWHEWPNYGTKSYDCKIITQDTYVTPFSSLLTSPNWSKKQSAPLRRFNPSSKLSDFMIIFLPLIQTDDFASRQSNNNYYILTCYHSRQKVTIWLLQCNPLPSTFKTWLSISKSRLHSHTHDEPHFYLNLLLFVVYFILYNVFINYKFKCW